MRKININRILVSVTAALSILMAVASVAVAEIDAKNRVWEVADNIYRFGAAGGTNGYYSMFVVTNDGVIAIEPVDPKHSQGLLAAIKSVTDQPVRYLLHSHNHWDHSKGGAIFRAEGAKIVTHVEAYEWMKANPHPDMALPDEVWKGKRKDIVLGGKTVQLHHLGMSHGLGMTVFVLPEEKMAYFADIVTPNRVLFTIVPDFNIREWTRTLKEVENLDFETAIFTHTQSTEPHRSKQDVVQTREFIADMQAAIIAEFKKGTGFVDIPEAVKLPKYKNWAMYDKWLPLNVWRVMLDMHMGPFPWHPDHAYETKRSWSV
jgi:glyoxylase-like metal-dependent hydrolase (beta-lactamase superfamily II)